MQHGHDGGVVCTECRLMCEWWALKMRWGKVWDTSRLWRPKNIHGVIYICLIQTGEYIIILAKKYSNKFNIQKKKTQYSWGFFWDNTGHIRLRFLTEITASWTGATGTEGRLWQQGFYTITMTGSQLYNTDIRVVLVRLVAWMYCRCNFNQYIDIGFPDTYTANQKSVCWS